MTASFNCFKHSGILATPIRCCIKWVPLTGYVSVFAFAPRPQLTSISPVSSSHTLAHCVIPAQSLAPVGANTEAGIQSHKIPS